MTSTHHTTCITYLSCAFFVCLFLLLPWGGYAADPEYVPLVEIGGLDADGSFVDLFNSIYKIILALGSIFGVLKIAIAGVKYSMSAIVSDKSSAISDIKGVLLGLLILFTPAFLLGYINPDLTKLDAIDRLSNEEARNGGAAGQNIIQSAAEQACKSPNTWANGTCSAPSCSGQGCR